MNTRSGPMYVQPAYRVGRGRLKDRFKGAHVGACDEARDVRVHDVRITHTTWRHPSSQYAALHKATAPPSEAPRHPDSAGPSHQMSTPSSKHTAIKHAHTFTYDVRVTHRTPLCAGGLLPACTGGRIRGFSVA
jgi:hypothetical protein